MSDMPEKPKVESPTSKVKETHHIGHWTCDFRLLRHIGHLSSFSLEHRFAFLKKRADAFALIFSREAQREEINFATQSLIKI